MDGDETAAEYPIVDSHIHLFPKDELETLAWWNATSALNGQFSVEEYYAATNSRPSLEGFIFVETDRKHDLESGAEDGKGWEMPLMEVDWIKRLALGTPREGQGHREEQKDACLAIVPWAPLPSGAKVLEHYVDKVRERAGDSFKKIKGFRYLVQSKPRGTMLTPKFIDSLKWLGRNGYVFDLGVDQHRKGKWMLDEAIAMIEQAREGVEEKDKVTFIINHLCKPDLTIYNPTDRRFVAWRTAMFTLSKCHKTYMKLSGSFSEMSASLKAAPADEIFLALQPYLVVLMVTFTPARIMFGSDWPVCTIGVSDAWEKWRQVVQRFCNLAGLSREDQIMLWSGTAIQAYGIKELM